MATGLITVAGSFCLASGIAKSQDVDDNVVNALAYCGKFFISGAYSLVYLVTGELFPTSVRLVHVPFQLVTFHNFTDRLVTQYVTSLHG